MCFVSRLSRYARMSMSSYNSHRTIPLELKIVSFQWQTISKDSSDYHTTSTSVFPLLHCSKFIVSKILKFFQSSTQRCLPKTLFRVIDCRDLVWNISKLYAEKKARRWYVSINKMDIISSDEKWMLNKTAIDFVFVVVR